MRKILLMFMFCVMLVGCDKNDDHKPADLPEDALPDVKEDKTYTISKYDFDITYKTTKRYKIGSESTDTSMVIYESPKSFDRCYVNIMEAPNLERYRYLDENIIYKELEDDYAIVVQSEGMSKEQVLQILENVEVK